MLMKLKDISRKGLCLLMIALFTLACVPFVQGGAHAASGKTVKVGYFNLSGFQEYDASSKTYSGYSYEYLLAIAQYAGWNLKLVPVNYNDGIRALKNGDIDVLNLVDKNIASEYGLLTSSSAIGEANSTLVVSRYNKTISYEDYTDFSSLSVGVVKGNLNISDFRAFCTRHSCSPKIVYYSSRDQLNEAFSNKDVDAVLSNSMEKVSGRVIAKFGTQPYYIATADSTLMSQLNSAMTELKNNDPGFAEKIYEKYYGHSGTSTLVLTASEKKYIKDHPTVTVSYDPSWFPISYRNSNGSFQGVSKELYDRISSETGLKFKFIASDTFKDSLRSFAQGKTQLMAELPYDYIWAKNHHARLTPQYTTITVVGAYMANRSQSGTKITVAIPPGYYQQFLMQKINKADYTFKNYDSIEDCLDAVKDGEVDYALLNSYQMEYYRTKARYKGLSSKVFPGVDYGLAIAVSDSADPKIFTIMTKSLQAIGSDEIDGMFRAAATSMQHRSLTDTMSAYPKTTLFIFTILAAMAAGLIIMQRYSAILRRKNAEIEAATNARSAFFANISHDMRTPLNGIIGYTELGLKADSMDEVKDDLGNIKSSGAFLLSLINDTLDLSKLENNMLTLNPKPVDSRVMVDEVITIVGQLAETKGVNFVADIPDELHGTVSVDKLRMQQIFINIISNAIKFTPAGGQVVLTVRQTLQDPDRPEYMISVRDTGCGMSDDFLPHVFDAYSQDPTSDRQAHGTGLGMSIVKKLVDAMGGRIEVYSQLGKGSEFKVFMSVESVADTASAPGDAGDDSYLQNKKALVCEDNEINMEILKSVLSEKGIIVSCAENGKAGVEAFSASAEGTFDMIFMDMHMPVMDGAQAIAEIRSLPRRDAAEVPIFILSGDSIPDTSAVGASDQLMKPIEPDVLFDMLRRYLL